MEMSYYEKLDEFLNKKTNKYIIYVLSPTYALYNVMRIKERSKKQEHKNFNLYLSNNTKFFFLALSLFIISMISVYDIGNMKNMKHINNTYKVTYILLCTLPLYLSFNYFLSLLKKVSFNSDNEESKYNKKYDCFKFIFGKKVIIIMNLIFISYCLLNSAGIIGFENNKILKLLLLFMSIYILGVSRPIHFMSVFILDILKKLTKGDKRDIDGKIRLVLLAIGSVVNIIVDYSILFYTLNTIGIEVFSISPMFNSDITNIVDMVYFTSGFSDIQPSNFITKILYMMKDISIFILMTGNLAIYLNMETKRPIKYGSNKRKRIKKN